LPKSEVSFPCHGRHGGPLVQPGAVPEPKGMNILLHTVKNIINIDPHGGEQAGHLNINHMISDAVLHPCDQYSNQLTRNSATFLTEQSLGQDTDLSGQPEGQRTKLPA
jgi:hypothetical protein